MPFKSKNTTEMRDDAVRIFYAGLDAVEAGATVKRYCKIEGNSFCVRASQYDLCRFQNIFVVGAGKASAPMAQAIEDLLGKRISNGIINVKYGHIADLDRIELVEAGHPVPDRNGEQGAQRILSLVRDAGKDDLVLCLISGGCSALLPLPANHITLKDKQDTIKILLSCGTNIHEINAIRKHVSKIKGGKLAKAAYPCSTVSLILSDVVGDDLDVIASGPTVPDSSTFLDCIEIFDKYNIKEKLPQNIVSHIEQGDRSIVSETAKPGDPAFESVYNLIIGSNIEAIKEAKLKAESLGYNTMILSSMIEGDTRQAAQFHTAIAKDIIKTGNPVSPPACILSGGETTVNVKGDGLGGRNQEFSLAAAIDIAGNDTVIVLSAGTDGTDGPTDAAGALADNNTERRAKAIGLDSHSFLLNNDSYIFFKKLDDLFITGPTNTNVMDLRIILVGPKLA
mmetsp:Transcript_21709/g.10139  ORF Transcript_21709/g.10139 Transcript_21709/m.10139 type:complete len:452 (+) Transcript_21709:1705-3060(+)